MPKTPLVIFLVLILLASLGTPICADDGWIPARGVAAIQGSRDNAAYRAERQALGRALARYLQTWLSDQELASEAKTMNDWFFASPRSYVAAVSSASTTYSGIQAIWQGLVRFDEDRVMAKLQEVGLVNAWDRDPRLELQLTGSLTHKAVTQHTWYRDLSTAGIVLLAPGASKDVHGKLTASMSESQEAHPLVPERQWHVTDVVLEGDIFGQRLSLRIAVGPEDRAPLASLTTALAIQSIFSAWLPKYVEARNARLWQAGEFRFDDFTAWLAFDRLLMDNRALFHDVYPHLVRRDETSLWITYRFLLNPSEVDRAEAWLTKQGNSVSRQEGQKFVVRTP